MLRPSAHVPRRRHHAGARATRKSTNAYASVRFVRFIRAFSSTFPRQRRIVGPWFSMGHPGAAACLFP